MNVLATFDGSECSEAIVPQLEWMARSPDVRFTFLSVVRAPHQTARSEPSLPTVAGFAGPGTTPILVSTAQPTLVEDRGEAIERALAERVDYLQDIVSRMPQGPKYSLEATAGDDAAAAIIRYAIEHKPDVIVMGTHGETGMIHRLFGDVAEQVVRCGVAPVLLVPSSKHRAARKACN